MFNSSSDKIKCEYKLRCFQSATNQSLEIHLSIHFLSHETGDIGTALVSTFCHERLFCSPVTPRRGFVSAAQSKNFARESHAAIYTRYECSPTSPAGPCSFAAQSRCKMQKAQHKSGGQYISRPAFSLFSLFFACSFEQWPRIVLVDRTRSNRPLRSVRFCLREAESRGVGSWRQRYRLLHAPFVPTLKILTPKQRFEAC